MMKKEFTDLKKLATEIEKDEEKQTAKGFLRPAKLGDLKRKIKVNLDGKEVEIDEHGFCLDK